MATDDIGKFSRFGCGGEDLEVRLLVLGCGRKDFEVGLLVLGSRRKDFEVRILVLGCRGEDFEVRILVLRDGCQYQGIRLHFIQTAERR